MELTGLKLVLVIAIVIAIIALTWYVSTKVTGRERLNIPAFVYTKITPDQFFGDFYDQNKGEFRMASSFAGSASATYYGLTVLRQGFRAGFGDQIFTSDAEMGKILNGLRSYYRSDGYYAEEGVDPVLTTSRVLQTAPLYSQKLDKAISLEWVNANSFANKSALKENQYDPEYQYNVMQVYKNIDSDAAKAKMREIGPGYITYYCSYEPQDASNSEYLRKKYYQISILSYLTGIKAIGPGACFKANDVEADRARLADLAFDKVDDIESLYYLHYLKQFYQIPIDPNNIIVALDRFYLDREFKEKIGDNFASLPGMYYASLIYAITLGHPL